MAITYADALTIGYPDITFISSDGGLTYENLVHVGGSAIPSKADLDAVIAARVKIDMWRAIQADRDRRKLGGVKVGTNWFHSDDTSRIQQLGLVMFGQSMPAGIMWKTMTGTFVPMTPTLAMQIFSGTAMQDTQIFSMAEQHRVNMMASSTPETYDFSTGWPPIYGE